MGLCSAYRDEAVWPVSSAVVNLGDGDESIFLVEIKHGKQTSNSYRQGS